MGLMKALVPSTILTLLVAALVGAAGASSARTGFLALESASMGGLSVFWSWPFFLTVMAINGLIVMRMANSDQR